MHIDWSSLFGRLHPLVVHFPIGLILGAAALELIGWMRKQPFPGIVFDAFLGVATAGAVASALTGWWFARQQENADGAMLQWHRWLGIGVAVLSAGTWFIGRRPEGARARRWLLLFTALVVAVCGHLGGLLVWHDDFFQ
ncbi:MAG TPA: DUF2231 domain-containing protein [Candidatus Didemnitutus sp.]|nr:DUF2231 domain-containing protein [Candidatus Didemnitutus sp.]